MSKLVEGQSVKIIDELSRHIDGYKVLSPKVDRTGMIAVEKDGKAERVHPERVITGDPVMTTVATPIAEPKVTTSKPKATPEKVNLDSLAASGELWIKSNIDFDGKTDVSTFCILFPTKGRYLSFNVYGGTYGKKGKTPPIDRILAGDEVGYPIKDAEKLRAKLVRDGYAKHGA